MNKGIFERRAYGIPGNLVPGAVGGTAPVGRKVTAAVAPPGQAGAAIRHTVYQLPLPSKQGISSVTNAPTHATPIDQATAIQVRGDAVITFATSIGANQPVGTLWSRARAYDGNGQFGEVEGRALPLAAWHYSYIRYLLEKIFTPPGHDIPLANTTQTWGRYWAMGLTGPHVGVSVQNVINQQPYTGTGAASAYAENDGASGEFDDAAITLGKYYIARAFGSGISAVNIKAARSVMLAAAADINTGFTLKAGGTTYTPEEINDIEDRINAYLASLYPLDTASGTVRNQVAQYDPYTGATVYLWADIFSQDTDVTITLNTPQAIQVACVSNKDIGAMTSA